MYRTEIIQSLINKCNAKKYLEIGMGPGINFNSIICEYKISVDPNPTVPVTFKLTSDDFFKQNKEKFDVIFIDGLHWCHQVYNDIINALNILNLNGYIICHDMNPHTELMQQYPQPKPNTEWTGDCWKAWVKLRKEKNNIEMKVVDSDYGCGIITFGTQQLINLEYNPYELNYQFLDANRQKLLNLISSEEFKKLL
jgi:hypothetical protein